MGIYLIFYCTKKESKTREQNLREKIVNIPTYNDLCKWFDKNLHPIGYRLFAYRKIDEKILRFRKIKINV